MSDNSPIDFSKLFKIPMPEKINTEAPVIVIDDQQDLRLIIVHQLQKLQFTTVKQASNGYEALEIMQETKGVSNIVCDMEMPVMGGLELLAELRERTDLERPPFCLIMDNVNKERLMLAVENGVDEVLVKPFTLSDIYPKVQLSWKKFHNPKNPEKIYELAKSALRNKKFDEADKIYKLLADSSEKSARPLVGLARSALGRKEPNKALEHLVAAEQRNKSYVHIFAARGEIYSELGKFDDALKSFEQAITLSPLNPVRYRSAADILFKKEKYKEAITLLEQAVKLGLEFKELYHYLSQANFAIKDYPKAQRYVKSALSLDPENVTYLNQLGICMKQQNMLDEATKVYNQIIKLDQDNIPALYNKAMLCEAKNEIPDAVKLLERALKKDPNFTAGKTKLAEMKAKMPKAG
jgi:two-component system chemotaxis response regulator CheY